LVYEQKPVLQVKLEDRLQLRRNKQQHFKTELSVGPFHRPRPNPTRC